MRQLILKLLFLVKNRTSLILFLSLLLSLILFFSLRIWQVKRINNIPFKPEKSFFKFEPPADALTGQSISSLGIVKKFSRDGINYQPVSNDERILQGESLATEKNSQAQLNFNDNLKIIMNQLSEINFISLMPDSVLIHQKSGTVIYNQTGIKQISIRCLHSLIVLNSAKSRVSLDNEDKNVTLEISDGSARIAFSDLENKTHVYDVEKGERVFFDDETREIQIKKAFFTF